MSRILTLVQTDTDTEIAETASLMRAAAGTAKSATLVSPARVRTYDDLSNAKRFLDEFGSEIRYLVEAKKWLVWEKTHWNFDTGNFVYDLATEFVSGLYAPENATDADSFKHAKRSNDCRGIDAMLKIAKNKSTVTQADMDTNPALFNCANGTIDLTTGDVRPHNRADLITKISPYEYNEDASCDRFQAFLDDVQPNPAIQIYLQEALGYSMTGTCSDRAFFILYGFGRNGKSVFVDLFSRIFGSYAQNTTAESLMKKGSGGGIPNDIARLRGSRFITCSETDEGKQLHESLLKAITGGDQITARFLFGEYFNFYFSGKLWIVTNHKPSIRDMSQGFWDRLKIIPFTTEIDKKDQIDKDRLMNILLSEASGILAWLFAGWRRYREKNQLTTPPEIEAEIAAYKFEQDSIAQFIAECCEVFPPDDDDFSVLDKIRYRAANPSVYAAYKRFCEANGEFARSQRRLSQNLAERGFVQQPVNGVRTWTGFRLIDV